MSDGDERVDDEKLARLCSGEMRTRELDVLQSVERGVDGLLL
jgi:hypothetical protein